MILASLGKLAVKQALTSSNQDSTNVIQIAAVDWAAMTDLWWVVQTTTVAATTSTFKFALVLSKEATLDTNIEVMSVLIAAITDLRVATVGRFIAAFNVGKMLKQILETDVSDYAYIGGLRTVSAGTISVNEFLSFAEPHTIDHRMTVDSNITNSIDVASAGSGA